MAPTFTLCPATPADSSAIAQLFALSWDSPFPRLQLGAIDTDTIAKAMAPRIADSMAKPQMAYMVMRDESNGEIGSVASWSLPEQVGENESAGAKEDDEDEKERQMVEDEAYRSRLPEGSSKDLIMEFNIGIREMRKKALKGRRCYLLENLATHPAFRGKGLASKLIKWALEKADDEDVLVYLDTASDNEAMRLYKKLGFQEGERQAIEELERFGGEGRHEHVALIRYPNTHS